MQAAKLFQNGHSQAVRIPRQFQFEGQEVFIQKVGDAVLLLPQDKVWENFLTGLDEFSTEFMAEGREDIPMDQRSKI